MYCTLAQAKAYAKATDGSRDNILLSYLGRVTERIRAIAQVDFEPWFQTKYFTANPTLVNRSTGTLQLRDYLLSPTSIVNDGNSLTFGTDVLSVPQNQTPIDVLRLSDVNGTIWRANGWYPIGTQFMDTIVITGYWGWRRYYNLQGWLSSNQTVQDASGINATTQTITVTNVNAPDSLFRIPTFSPGNLIQIDSEMMTVYAINPTLNTLSVQRGANGSGPGVSHAHGAAINIWEPEVDISEVAARQTAFFYSRLGSYEEVQVTDVARVQYPRDLLSEIYDVLQKLGVS